MAVVAVENADGRSTRMTTERLARVVDQGWRAVDPGQVVETTAEDNIDVIVGEVGDDPVKAAAALKIEKAGKNRSTLVAKLKAIADQ